MLSEIIATGLFAGKSKFAPGTVGTLVGIPLAILSSVHWLVFWLTVLVLTVAGTVATQRVIDTTGEPDPEEVVIDEIVGYLLAFLFVPVNTKTVIVGFFLFRALDILKPFPIKFFEALPGAYGVMADDIVAGIMTAVILWLIF